jgi:hypothetical protein
MRWTVVVRRERNGRLSPQALDDRWGIVSGERVACGVEPGRSLLERVVSAEERTQLRESFWRRRSDEQLRDLTVIATKLAGDGEGLTSAPSAGIGKQDLLLHCDMTKEVVTEALVSKKVDRSTVELARGEPSIDRRVVFHHEPLDARRRFSHGAIVGKPYALARFAGARRVGAQSMRRSARLARADGAGSCHRDRGPVFRHHARCS